MYKWRHVHLIFMMVYLQPAVTACDGLLSVLIVWSHEDAGNF